MAIMKVSEICDELINGLQDICEEAIQRTLLMFLRVITALLMFLG